MIVICFILFIAYVFYKIYTFEAHLAVRLILALIAIIISVYILYWYDYKRFPNATKEQIPTEYKVTYVATQKGISLGGLLRPYVWLFRQPVKILYINNMETARINSRYYCTQFVLFDYDLDEPTSQTLVYDVINHTHFKLKTKEEIQKIANGETRGMEFFKNKEWVDNVLDTFLPKFIKPYKMMDELGDDVDVSYYISSGLYNVKRAFKDTIVYSLTNNHPYTPNKKDVELLLNKLRKDYSGKYVIPNNLDTSNIEYDETIWNWVRLVDVFKLNLKNNKNTLDSISFTYSKLINPSLMEYENSVVIIND